MAGVNEPGDLPPEVPPEYADAYRRAYERALREIEGGDPAGAPAGQAEGGRIEVAADEDTGEQDVAAPGTEATAVLPRMPAPPPPAAQAPATAATPVPPASPPGGETASGPVWSDDVPEILAPAVGGRHVQTEEYDEEERARRRYLPPLLLLVLALVLVLAAYGIGRIFAGGVDRTDTATGRPDGVSLGEGDDSGVPQGKQDAKRYRGPVRAAVIGGAQASCQSDDSVDAAGNPVSYEPANAYDGDLSTAWRCDGSGVGATFTVNLARRTGIGEVGLVPGYAKTDPISGVDRYAENSRITRVRWVFGDGTTQVQTMSGSATDRDLRRLRIPRTASDQVTVEILDSRRGPRNTVAISEVWIGAAAG